jgi:hypothetical protein
MFLTFFSDCHVEIEGEDSVHYRKAYRVDEGRHVILVKDLMELRQSDGGALIDSSERNDTLWQRLEGAGEWSVTGKPRPLQVPRECTCVGAACEQSVGRPER